jgi:hypothetical protein
MPNIICQSLRKPHLRFNFQGTGHLQICSKSFHWIHGVGLNIQSKKKIIFPYVTINVWKNSISSKFNLIDSLLVNDNYMNVTSSFTSNKPQTRKIISSKCVSSEEKALSLKEKPFLFELKYTCDIKS